MTKIERQRLLARIAEQLWERTDDSEEGRDGEVTITLTRRQADRMYSAFWRLGGKYRRTLEDCGWSLPRGDEHGS